MRVTQRRLDREWNDALPERLDFFRPIQASTPLPEPPLVIIDDTVDSSNRSSDGSYDLEDESSQSVSSWPSVWDNLTSSEETISSQCLKSMEDSDLEYFDVDDTTISDDLIWTAKERPVEVSYTPPWTPTPEPIEFEWNPTSPPPIETTPEPLVERIVEQPDQRIVCPEILPLGQHNWDSLANLYRSENIRFNVYFNPLLGQYILNPINDINKYC